MNNGSQDNYRELAHPLPKGTATCGVPVGVLEMAGRLGIQDRSIHMIRRRGQLPRPDYDNVNGSRAWEWSTILWWAGETGRLRSPELRAEYTARFKLDPPIVTSNRTPRGVVTRPDKREGTPRVPSMAKTS